MHFLILLYTMFHSEMHQKIDGEYYFMLILKHKYHKAFAPKEHFHSSYNYSYKQEVYPLFGVFAPQELVTILIRNTL